MTSTADASELDLLVEKNRFLYKGKLYYLKNRRLEMLRCVRREYPFTVSNREMIDGIWGSRIDGISESSLYKTRTELNKLLTPLGLHVALEDGIGLRLEVIGDARSKSLATPAARADAPLISHAEKLKVIARARLNIFTRESLRSSIEKYEAALRDHHDAKAYADLAISYINAGHVGFCLERPDVAVRKAKTLIDEALRHYPKSSSAFAIRSLISVLHDHDWKKAETDLIRASEENPKDGYVHMAGCHFNIARKRFDEAIEHAKLNAQLRWDNPIAVFSVPWTLTLAGKAEAARVECEKAFEFFDGFAIGHLFFGQVLDALGDHEKAVDQYKKSLSISEHPDTHGSLGFALGKIGERKSAEDCLERLREMKLAYLPSYCEALVATGLGQPPRALRALEAAYDQGCLFLVYMSVDPRWEPIRGEPRFQAIVKRLDLP